MGDRAVVYAASARVCVPCRPPAKPARSLAVAVYDAVCAAYGSAVVGARPSVVRQGFVRETPSP